MSSQLSIDFDAPPRFNGSDYSPASDNVRLGAQFLRVMKFMASGDWHTLREIADATNTPEASASAQLRHARKSRFGGHTVEKRNRGEPSQGLWEYRITPPT